MVRVLKSRPGRIRQGDVISDVDLVESFIEKNGYFETSLITYPLAIVLTQDCDLEQDSRCWSRRPSGKPNEDKFLVSILLAPIYNFEQVRLGQHLSRLERTTQIMGGEIRKSVMRNQNQRYHFLQFPESLQLVDSLIDFKHYFSVEPEYLRRLRKRNYVTSLASIYREDVSQRFANYLSRIGLP